MKKFMTTKGQVDSAIIDGYTFGDRLLEGVKFIITIDKKGKFHAEVHPEDKSYMEDFNEKKWLKRAVEYVEDDRDGFEDDVWIEWDEDDEPTATVKKAPVPIQMANIKDILGIKKV